jgi:phospholipid/cholesterol/gamma-HCH transport system ATP-binding protein
MHEARYRTIRHNPRSLHTVRRVTPYLRRTSGLVEGEDYWRGGEQRRTEIGRSRFGVLFQNAALWSAMTVGMNVALPMQMFTKLNEIAIRRLVMLKLGLVGIEHAADLFPAEFSGGMRKRAGLARALALDPDILFFDEPSAGLDPITSSRLDDLILNLRDGLGATRRPANRVIPGLRGDHRLLSPSQ